MMDSEQCWQAVLNREQAADGTFVYAVRSTGIYCRPSCPSRRPQRAQVAFFADGSAADQAGFRPCKRCQPQHERVTDPNVALVARLCRLIEAHASDPIPLTLTSLSAMVHLSQSHVQRTFKRIAGISPRQYIHACRVRQLQSHLSNGATVTEAVYEAGFSSASRVYESGASALGMTPGTYQRGGQGMHIRYTTVDHRLGTVLIAMTERGVCAVTLGDNATILESTLQRTYPQATLEHDATATAAWASAILLHLDGEQPHLDLPLDVQATAFQQRVWAALRDIPYGSTRSYSEVARAIGQPSATRAVAQACGANRVALVIPCHRVVREDGDLGGYRWGVERKRALLAQERGGNLAHSQQMQLDVEEISA